MNKHIVCCIHPFVVNQEIDVYQDGECIKTVNCTFEQLEDSFELGDLGTQVVVMSEKGMNKLTFLKSFLSEEKYIMQYYQTIDRATKRYDSFSKNENGTRIFQLMERMKK